MLGSHLGDTDHGRTAARDPLTTQSSRPNAGLREHMIDHRLDAGLVGDIGPDEAHDRATFCLQRPPFGFAATGSNNTRTLGDKHFRDAFADATGRTCYDSDLSVESAHERSPYRVCNRRTSAGGLGKTRIVKLRYTLPALADLAAILDYIAEHSPQGARRVQARIQIIIELSLQHPHIGTRTNDPTIRRMTALPLPILDFLRSRRR